jgi:hypothetical protein
MDRRATCKCAAEHHGTCSLYTSLEGVQWKVWPHEWLMDGPGDAWSSPDPPLKAFCRANMAITARSSKNGHCPAGSASINTYRYTSVLDQYREIASCCAPWPFRRLSGPLESLDVDGRAICRAMYSFHTLRHKAQDVIDFKGILARNIL